MNWLGQLKVRLFPPVTQGVALDIARQALAQPVTAAPLICHARKPARLSRRGFIQALHARWPWPLPRRRARSLAGVAGGQQL